MRIDETTRAAYLQNAREQYVSGRVYADGVVGIILHIGGDADPKSVRYVCKTGMSDLGEFDTLEAAVEFAARYQPPEPEAKMIAGRTVDEWRAFARRDDCFDHMVPSDLREILQHCET